MPSIAATANLLTRSGTASITYTGLTTLQMGGGKGNDTYNIESLADNDLTRIYSGGGNDVYNVSPVAHNLDNLAGILDLEGSGPGTTTGTATLTVNDQAHTGARTWLMQSGSMVVDPSAGSTAQMLQLSDNHFNRAVINGGSGGNTFKVTGNAAGTSTTVLAGAGNDTIQMAATLSSMPGPMAIDGQGGMNTLDYSAYHGDIVVDLQLGVATGFAGGVKNIQDVIGSVGNDILVGNGGNTLTGGSGRNLLIAGPTASTLKGGPGQNILVGGTTVDDTNVAALDSILSEWENAGESYGTRVKNLLGGGGLNGTVELNVVDVPQQRRGQHAHRRRRHESVLRPATRPTARSQTRPTGTRRGARSSSTRRVSTSASRSTRHNSMSPSSSSMACRQSIRPRRGGRRCNRGHMCSQPPRTPAQSRSPSTQTARSAMPRPCRAF